MPNRDPYVRSYHELPRVQHFHRALGGYIEMYSQGVSTMRQSIESFLSESADAQPERNALFHILFAGMTAKPIADAYFGMASAAGRLSADETAVRNVLRRDWERQTGFRNDLAHAEWSVGWIDAATGDPMPPGSARIKSVDGVPTLTNLGIDTNVIIREINALTPLVDGLRIFGGACRLRQLGRLASILDYFEIVEPSGGEPRRVIFSHPGD